MVIISSFYNEEYLLPWWLDHHKDMFEHGILFNYFSKDKSVEIIKRICPSWEVRNTRNKDWDPQTNDQEFMDAEKEVSGYKITLTTTEFLVGSLPKLAKDPTTYKIPIVRMVDSNPDEKPFYGMSLLKQKNMGFLDRSFRKRFLHNHPDGAYSVGRDRTSHKKTPVPMWIYKYVFSPWTKEMKARRLQMKTHMSHEHLIRGWGRQHKHSRESLEKEYTKAVNRKDLKLWTYQY